MKHLPAFFLFCLLIPLFSACGQPQTETLPQPVSEWKVTDGITLRLEYEEYPVAVDSMRMILENRTDSVMLYGQGWSFETYEGGEWKPLPIRENVGFTSEGYLLNGHSRDTFVIPTWFLKEPLGEGLYRLTGCTLRVAADDENLSYGMKHTNYPAYQLSFHISKDAATPAKASEEELPRADWEWVTPWEAIGMYESDGLSVWEFVEGKHGLMAILYRDDTPEQEILGRQDLLLLDLFDRTTGKRYPVYGEPTLPVESVAADEESGFCIRNSEGLFSANIIDGELKLSQKN